VNGLEQLGLHLKLWRDVSFSIKHNFYAVFDINKVSDVGAHFEIIDDEVKLDLALQVGDQTNLLKRAEFLPSAGFQRGVKRNPVYCRFAVPVFVPHFSLHGLQIEHQR